MIAVDTNVLVRLLVQDDARQADLARRLLEDSAHKGERCFVSDPVLCELEWVLDSCYAVPRQRIVHLVQELLSNEAFEFENRQVVHRALEGFKRKKGDFSDHLIGQKATARGIPTTYTFDRALRNQAGFTVLV